MQKRNLKTFKYMNKIVKTKVQEKVIELQEEKSLISIYLIASCFRPFSLTETFNSLWEISNLVLSWKLYLHQMEKL